MNKMVKLIIYVVVLLLFFTCLSTISVCEEQDSLKEIIEPDSISIDENQIYIPQQTSIYIYDLNSLKLKSKIGKKGEGPQEFMLNVVSGHEELIINVNTANLIVNSIGKISYFSKKDYLFIREIKNITRSRDFKPFGNGYAGQGMMVKDGIQSRSINIYDGQLNKIKRVCSVKHHFQINEGLRVLSSTMNFCTQGRKLFVAWSPDFIIHVYDQSGDRLYIIHRDFDRITIPESTKDNIINYLKISKKYKRIFEAFNIKVHFPDKFPAIENMLIDNSKIYVITYGFKENNSPCLVLDLKGKLLKELNLPIIRSEDSNGFLPYPYTISRGKLYQLVNEEEQYKLKISKF